MVEKDFEVVVIGRACVDHLCVVEEYPKEDAKVPMSRRLVEGGGQGATAACCAARLGGRVAYVGCLGDDKEGQFCMKRLHDFCVDTSQVKVIPGGRTPYAYVLITATSGKRTIVYEPGTLPVIEFDTALLDLFHSAGSILLGPQATNLARPLLDAPDLPPMVYDCERDRPGLEDMMALVDYFIPHYGFLDSSAFHISGSSKHERILSLAGLVRGRLIVTDGEHGAYYLDEERLIRVHPPKVLTRDTTGAGDNFHGAFALALSRGFDLHDAVRFSTAVASLSCREYGGRAGLPDYEEAVEVMKTIG
jgi:sulfofructose kinase